jgi:hypothetical protein
VQELPCWSWVAVAFLIGDGTLYRVPVSTVLLKLFRQRMANSLFSHYFSFFVGSFSDFCHHSAKCPVLVVKNVSATGQTKTSAAEPESSVTTQVQDNVVDAL